MSTVLVQLKQFKMFHPPVPSSLPHSSIPDISKPWSSYAKTS